MDNLKELLEAKTLEDLSRYFFVEIMMAITSHKITCGEGQQILDNVNRIIKKESANG